MGVRYAIAAFSFEVVAYGAGRYAFYAAEMHKQRSRCHTLFRLAFRQNGFSWQLGCFRDYAKNFCKKFTLHFSI